MIGRRRIYCDFEHRATRVQLRGMQFEPLAALRVGPFRNRVTLDPTAAAVLRDALNEFLGTVQRADATLVDRESR